MKKNGPKIIRNAHPPTTASPVLKASGIMLNKPLEGPVLNRGGSKRPLYRVGIAVEKERVIGSAHCKVLDDCGICGGNTGKATTDLRATKGDRGLSSGLTNRADRLMPVSPSILRGLRLCLRYVCRLVCSMFKYSFVWGKAHNERMAIGFQNSYTQSQLQDQK